MLLIDSGQIPIVSMWEYRQPAKTYGASMIIARIWAKQPGQYFCLSTKSPSGKFRDHFFTRDEFPEIRDFLRDHKDSDVWFCPHGFKQKKRVKEFAVLPLLLWADLDEVHPAKLKLRPTIAFESSPGRHVGLWLMDSKVSEELNRKLTYSIGADISGWDLTQLLRVPGTLNYKYDDSPRVRVLWADGEKYSVQALERELPDAPSNIAVTSDAAQAYQRWEGTLPHWCRRELITKTPPKEGKRSEMLFKLANTMLECGVPRADGVAMLQASVWNKYEGRRDEDRQLGRSWDKAVNKHLKPKKATKGSTVTDSDKDYQFISRSLADIEEREFDWVWYPYLARGEVTILQGDPEAGKSFISQNVSGHILTGKQLPCHVDGMPTPKGVVVYFDLENTADTVTVKRMRWNGYHGEMMKNFYQEEHPFSIDDDEAVDKVCEGLARVNPTLVVFDTLNTYIGKADTNQGAQSQQSFIRFKKIASQFNCAVLVLRHLTKGSRDKAMYRGQGSIAFTGVCRVEITAGMHPTEAGLRVMARSKGNLTKRPPALTYEIIDRGNKQERDKSEFRFGDFEDLTAEDIVSVISKDDRDASAKAMNDAQDFLGQQLSEGPKEVRSLVKMAEARAINDRTLRRAADQLGVVRKMKGFGSSRETYWSLKV